VDPKNPQVLAAFYNGIAQEIMRLWDERWRLSYYFVAEGSAVILLFLDGKTDRFLNKSILILLFLIQVLCVCFYFWHMWRNHNYLADARSVRQRAETFFRLNELKLPDGQSIMPDKWLNKVNPNFEFNSVGLPLALFVAAVQFASMYLIANVALALGLGS
jgi:hypothetical protein